MQQACVRISAIGPWIRIFFSKTNATHFKLNKNILWPTCDA